MDGDVANSTQTSNSSTLGTLAADKLITAINDPIAQWDVLSEDEVNLIKKRCEELLDWFTFLEAENLTNYEVVVPSDYLQRRQNKPCFDPHRMKDVADRFAEKGSIDFEDEFEENKRNAKFEILCEALQLDKAVYHMVKKLLAADSNSTLTPKQLIVQTLCSPIDCCLALTMAYCEVSGWPYSCDWDAITYAFKNWTEEDQKVFNQIIEEEAKRQWNATKAFVMDPRFMNGRALSETSSAINPLDTVEVSQTLSHREAEKHEAVVKERQEAISNLVPANMRDRPRLTDEELERLDKEIEEVRARMMAVQKPSEWPAPPEDGLAGRLVLAEGDYCLARKEDLASLAVGQILNRISATSYRVTFVETGDVEEVESADIAVPAVPMYDPDMKRTNYIGLRVAALVASPYFYNRPMWSTGTVGTLPNTAHNKEFLIFFDDGFEQYVQAAFESSDDDAMKVSAIKGDLLQQFTKKIRLLKILPLARQSLASNGIDAYNSNGDRVTAYVVSTNRALCVLRFPPRSASYGAGCFNYPCTTPGHVHVDETIFRGSSRLHAVNLEHFGSNNMSARRMAKNRSQFDVVQPGPCPDRLKTSSIMARKSSAPVRSEGGPEDVINYEMDPQTLALRRKKEAQLYMHESSLRRVSEGRILYRAPCGRSLVSKQCVASYLKITGSELTIDLFCFDPVIETKTFVHVDDSFVKTPDFAQGLEHLPIPAVNTIDDEDPPTISYCARRFPYNHQVDVKTISRDYCSGCSCTDDCSDPLKCECQRLTVAMVRRLAKSFRPARGEYGYSYRKLLGKTITGVFECNDNCGCQQKRCYNRVVQQPIRYPIQIYKTAQSGWGVRAMCDIPAGAFIANYVGALLTDSLADALHGEDEYFADLDLNDAVENEKATTLEKCGYLDLGIGSEEEEDQNPKQKRSSEDDGIGSDTSSQSSSASEEEEPKMKRKRKKKEEVENVGQRRKKLNQAELEKS
ncbi:unnamed protein product [Nippostrongylus brasiliensis]|uniref:Histone-lysine N-methyltransferase met-2 (inferred by orthology to a C. elegans protein) n=1 Tax=Nippostrongylus brasiliensis TaxID=27835 RepID=A0A0N4Y337_NIPBR|nr:unnamed protein product [Nippostrongylus brasiliensis]